MKLYIAGGVGEHGRSCFFVEGTCATFIVDCGIMDGSETPYPHLTDAQIQAAKFLLITHSHIDHTGAFHWLVERGFSDCVIMTRETAVQLPLSPDCVCLIDEMAPALSDIELLDGFSVQWGRSGQCAGSVWYIIRQCGMTMLFSGDYVEDTLVYCCEPLRNVHAETAILDSAYGEAEETANDYREIILNRVKNLMEQGKRILFPVPKYGRGLELLLLLHNHFPRAVVSLDRHLENELSRIDAYKEWIKPESFHMLQEIRCSINANKEPSVFLFLSDPQLKSPAGRALAAEILAANDAVLITGYADAGSYSEELLASKCAEFSRYAVHMSHAERKRLESLNAFSETIPYHCGDE